MGVIGMVSQFNARKLSAGLNPERFQQLLSQFRLSSKRNEVCGNGAADLIRIARKRLFELFARPVRVECFHRIARLEFGGFVIRFGDVVFSLVAMQQEQPIAVFNPCDR